MRLVSIILFFVPLLIISCRSNPRYLIKKNALERPEFFIEPFVDIRYFDKAVSFELLDFDVLERDSLRSEIIKKELIDYLTTNVFGGKGITEKRLDSAQRVDTFSKIFKSLNDDFGFANYNHNRFLPTKKSLNLSPNDKTENLKGSSRVVFIWVVSAYNASESFHTKINKAFNVVTMNAGETTEEQLPYTISYVGIYNLGTDKLEYYYEGMVTANLNKIEDFGYFITDIRRGLTPIINIDYLIETQNFK